MDFDHEARLLTITVPIRWFYPYRVGRLGLDPQVSVRANKENGRRVIVLHSGCETTDVGC